MRRLLLLCALAGLLSGCALRPTYKAFVSATTTGPDVKLVLVEKATARPLPNVKIELSEWKNRYSTTTGADGTFTLPVAKKYLDEDPVLVVAVPAGVKGYEIWTPRAAEAPPPELPPATVAPEAPAPTDPVKM